MTHSYLPEDWSQFEGKLLHSQGLDHYGTFESTAPLPYARL